jgi:hypothetical protein
LDYPDDETEEEFPDKGYYKTWSSCWYDSGSWGGNNCIQIDSVVKEENFLYSMPMVPVIIVMLIAALIRRR